MTKIKQSRASYSAYLEAYNKQERKLNKKGLEMNQDKLTRRQFEAVYSATRNDLKKEVSTGDRKVIGNVTQYIVREQAYKVSHKQYKFLRDAYKLNIDYEAKEEAKLAKLEGRDFDVEAFKKTQKRATAMQIRTGKIDFSFLKYKYAEYKDLLSKTSTGRSFEELGYQERKGITKEASKLVSQYYYMTIADIEEDEDDEE